MMLRIAKIAALALPLLLAGCETVQEIKSFKLSDIDMDFLWHDDAAAPVKTAEDTTPAAAKTPDAAEPAPVKSAEAALPVLSEVEGLQHDDLRAPFGTETVAVASRDGL